MEENKFDKTTMLPVGNIKVIPTMQMEFNTEFWQLIPIALKSQWENFCQYIMSGQNATDAYWNAFHQEGKDLKRESCASKGSKLLKNIQIQNRCRQLHAMRIQYFVMSDLEIEKELSIIAKNTGEDTSDRLTALKTLAQIKNMFKKDDEIKSISNFVDLQVNIVESKNKKVSEDDEK